MKRNNRSIPVNRRALLRASALLPLAGLRPARAQDSGISGNVVRIGVLTDESGPYADSAGPGSILAARMAAEDRGGTVRGARIEIVHGDTQNKPDVAAAIARRWFDSEGVDAIVDLPVTPIALAVQQIAREKNRTVMITAAAISEFTSKFCSPVSTHWADDTHALTAATAGVVAQGGSSWFFITVDMTFGHALQESATAVIRQAGGKVVGSAQFPIGASDFSSLLLQAQSSGAKVIGLAAVGSDLVNLLKQASEFGIRSSGAQSLAGFLIYIDDVHALGLAAAQGFAFPSSFYWDQNDSARAFGRRFFEQRKLMPSRNQAAIHTAVTHYLKAIDRAGTDEAVAVGRAMRQMPVDYFGHPASVRSDGRVLYDVTLYRVKTPAESRHPWDYYQPLRTIPAAQAFLPVNAQACPA